MPITIGFHDVVEDLSQAQPIGTGFTTAYTLDRRHFRSCLDGIHSRLKSQSVRVVGDNFYAHESVLLTFDDGMESSLTIVAPELERFGWRGHFFITTDWIGRTGFLSGQQILELLERGHIVGSHSSSHPHGMWKLSEELLLREWTESRKRLSELLGYEVTIASVPGGYYTPRVAAVAAASGYRVLFTSEPTTKVSNVDGCRVFGRYTARRNTSASAVAAIAAGATWDRWRQAGMWAATKAAKRVAGKWYLPLRNALLEFKPGKTSKAIS
jgi:peptidoglycan/xylan/chitin deacetylase (PgdA/CDA1 family)